MLTNRQKLILKAIVESYIEDGLPVGSRTITGLPYLDYSSATIRFDMQMLEELGYLDKTHTSSGRIPSERGLRYYLDNLLTRDRRVVKLFPLVDDIFQKHRYSKKKILEKAADLLSAVTNYTAISLNPSDDYSYIKKMEFIKISDVEGVIIIVVGDGTVLHHKLTVTNDLSIEEVEKFFISLNELLKNKSITKVMRVLVERYNNQKYRPLKSYEENIIKIIVDLLETKHTDDFYLSGATNMLHDDYFSNFQALKESMIQLNEANISKLISSDTGLQIRIGSDISFMPKSEFTIISIPYRFSDWERGNLALIGPMRMNYSEVVPLIEYIAINLSNLYSDKE
ncbi:MAG: heat-inducible transcriptional repressor HrcA [Acholeplasmataceae bacterium]|jgi:heat-inducible transcriptional repressor